MTKRPAGRRLLAAATAAALALPMPALAQSQGYKTGYGRLQPPAAGQEAPTSGLSLTTTTLAITGLLAGAVVLGLSLADGGGGDDDDAPAGGMPPITGTSTR
jgi:hypothetical protein